jgi:hypothetical protein
MFFPEDGSSSSFGAVVPLSGRNIATSVNIVDSIFNAARSGSPTNSVEFYTNAVVFEFVEIKVHFLAAFLPSRNTHKYEYNRALSL